MSIHDRHGTVASERTALLLDFDGTLVDIAPTPASVRVPEGLREDLAAIASRLSGAVALVSGRPIAELDSLLSPLRLAAAGEHGATLRASPSEAPRRVPLPTIPAAWRSMAERWANDTQGVLVEHKPAGFVLHYRLAPEAGAALHASLLALLGDHPEFDLTPASAAWEVRPRGIDKGGAVRALMARPPFMGRQPIYVGDDTTDEDGIAAAQALGGEGLRVPECFGDAAGVRTWLARIAAVRAA